jgi:murein DD-endopeptidase MepM/ murein hydrolase activator NlpD
MPLNLTATSLSDLIAKIRQVNLQPNNADLHTITLSVASFPATVNAISAASGAGGDADLFGLCALPVVLRNLRIVGNGKTIQRNSTTSNLFRIFGVNAKKPSGASSNAKLVLENMRIGNGNSGNAGGGAIVADGPLTLINCYVVNNTGGTNGGAIYNGDGQQLNISGCIFSGNIAAGNNARGGAIYNSSGSGIRATDSTFVNNSTPNVGSLGAVVYSLGNMLIRHCSIIGNQAAGNTNSGAAFSGGTLDISWNWWGGVNGNGGPLPYLTTLPRFIRPGGFTGPNPSLPATASCTINSFKPGAITRRGPSAQDLTVPLPSIPIAARVKASEGSIVWLGFVHPTNRADYLSWVKLSDVNLNTAGCEAGLPDWSAQPNSDWSTTLGSGSSWLSHLPLRSLDTSREQLGFARFSSTLYPNTGGYHTGFDFFPPSGTDPDVLAATSGIVVGIGVANSNPLALVPPANWGAAGFNNVGFNLVIRVGRYFILYGHLRSIDDALYLGARVGPAAVLGKLASQPSNNTHLHLEVRGFTASEIALTPVSCFFGSILNVSGAQPARAIDPMRFIQNRGSFSSADTNGDHYTGAQLLSDMDAAITFNYFGYENWNNSDTALKCFNVISPPAFYDVGTPNCDLPSPCP